MEHKRRRTNEGVTVASCPGKVLVAGGYAVLERPNTGLVLSTTARFHSEIGWDGDAEKVENGELEIEVFSPQYAQQFTIKVKEDGESIVAENIQGDRNKYVEQTVAYGLAAGVFLSSRLARADDLEKIISNPEMLGNSVTFQDILASINLHFEFKNCGFRNGDMVNSATANQGSLKVLAMAKYLGLSDETTVQLWGEHYRHVKDDPNGDSHGNIRAFMKTGMAGVSFDEPLEGILLQDSDGARALREKTSRSEEFSGLRELVNSGMGKKLRIVLCADNDFYSQQTHLKSRNLPYSTESLRTLPQFLPCCNERGETEVSKTGLGSSAAMVTSLVAALMSFCIPTLQLSGTQLDLVHAVAQLTHNVIQGKIGSGFDVCAAAYGSMKYVRYEPTPLNTAMSAGSIEGGCTTTPTRNIFLECLHRLNHSVKPFSLPPRLELICGDVCGGSETPSMSRKILDWKNSGQNSKLWEELLEKNNEVSHCFDALHSLHDQNITAYNEALDLCSASGKTWADLEVSESTSPVLLKLLELRTVFLRIRELFRLIGEEADVPVEPKEQTSLCDASMDQNGVVICGVPGAGGYDAVFAIVIDKSRSQLELFWGSYKENTVCALLLGESSEHPGIQLSSRDTFCNTD